ncbi:hypothetical protein ACFXNW_15515 [Nocardia sp. NPDC059180]|uniref:hypothetical protein n=1 Tax=Nocardia sp. NPDC059180 TaxID=3346761 RepID=UPI0036C02513
MQAASAESEARGHDINGVLNVSGFDESCCRNVGRRFDLEFIRAAALTLSANRWPRRYPAIDYDRHVEFLAGPPSRWIVTLKSGSIIELWADGYSEESDHYVFSTLVRASHEEQLHVEVESRDRVTGEKVVMVVARVPAVEVASLYGGPIDLEVEAD